MELAPIVEKVLAVPKFIGERLVGGAFAALADIVYPEETHEANMEHLTNVVRGEE